LVRTSKLLFVGFCVVVVVGVEVVVVYVVCEYVGVACEYVGVVVVVGVTPCFSTFFNKTSLDTDKPCHPN
jgi:hypothetical protein